MSWKFITHFEDGQKAPEPWYEIECKSGKICLEKRPHYCDRGNWYAKADVRFNKDIPGTYSDSADGWPRYYFDLDRAKLELEAWINKRGLAL